MKAGDKFVVGRGAFQGFEAVVLEESLGGYRCAVDVFGTIVKPVLSEEEMVALTKEQLAERVRGLSPSELKTLRAMINGMLGKRTISKEQQAEMQRARKKSR